MKLPPDQRLNYSDHAIDRMLQRGISEKAIQQVLTYGKSQPAFGNRVLVRLADNPFLSTIKPELSPLRDLIIVLGPDKSVITVQFADYRFRGGP